MVDKAGAEGKVSLVVAITFVVTVVDCGSWLLLLVVVLVVPLFEQVWPPEKERSLHPAGLSRSHSGDGVLALLGDSLLQLRVPS